MRPIRAFVGFLSAFVVFAGLSQAAFAQDPPPLDQRVTPEILAIVFPEADEIGPAEGAPPIITAYKEGEPIGYIFSTYDVVRAPSYSPRPFDAIVGMDLEGRLVGVKMITYHDPYLKGYPYRFALLEQFLGAYVAAAYPVMNPNALDPESPYLVDGATISARQIRSGVLDAGRVVYRATSNQPPITEPTLDVHGFAYLDWPQLLQQGAVVQREVTYGEVRQLFDAADRETAEPDIALGVPENVLDETIFECRFAATGRCDVRPLEPHPDDEIYIDLYVALGTPAMIGRNALGSDFYARVTQTMEADANFLVLLSRGDYDFRGLSYYRGPDYIFDRVRLEQGDLSFTFNRDLHEQYHVYHGQYGGGRPYLPEASSFVIPADTGFDPLAPFTLVLLINGADAAGAPVAVEVPIEYAVPPSVVLVPYVEPPPAWVESWRASAVDLGILVVSLLVLTLIFIFQGRMSKSRRAHRWIRNGFLIFTLVWVGWIAGAQLSIVHVVNYIKAPFDGVDFGFYVAEPLIVVLGIYVVLSVILIGRGLFCGWLCPFGALQELASKIGRFFKLPTWNPPERMQRWMWLPKYGIAAIVVGTAFAAPAALAAVEEVEPFKTAITSIFTRPWPYVTYAAVLVFMGLFTERFFCRFLCPLGAILAVFDRLHIFNFLKRRSECGTACQLCERGCPVKAIESSGKIVMAECFQCLDCMVDYYDDRRCPPLAKQRKQRDRQPIPPMGSPIPAYARSSTPVYGADK
jgi:transcriptional regulator of nitric oxide reductase